MREISKLAPAKVNTLLRVVGQRENGYHDLEMVMVPLSLCDELVLGRAPSGVEFRLTGAGDRGMAGEKNLAVRAARLMMEAAGIRDGVRIQLTKRIPIAAGLGGGSSDAAAVLLGINELWGLGWSAVQLAELGVRLGADVPFFCYEKAAYVEGIGERVAAYDTFPLLFLLIVNPSFAVPTPWVYQQWDLQLTPKTSGARVRPLFQAVSDVVATLHNDLERVTIPAYPEIAAIKEALGDAGAAGALMSGSGPTVYGIFVDAAVRDAACERLRMRKGWRVFAAEGARIAPVM
jgi:4-diphosphocytidyl-2-C-methyl-D-erythritol kinase